MGIKVGVFIIMSIAWKNNLLVIFAGTCVFFVLSFLLQAQISVVHAFCDIDSSAYLWNGFLFYKYWSFSPPAHPQIFPIYALGYPFIIGLLYKIFGQSVFAIILVQLFFAWLSGLLIFIIARRLYNDTVARIAFLLFSINLGFLVFSHFILAETFLTFFLILFFERVTAFWQSKNLFSLAVSGLALGCSILMKAAALYFPFLFIPFVLWFITKNFKFKSTVIFFGAFFVPLVCFMTHNKLVFNEFRLTRIDIDNVYFWFYPRVRGYMNNTSMSVELSKLGALSRDEVKKQFWHDFNNSPGLFIGSWVKHVFKDFIGLFTTHLKVLVDYDQAGGRLSFFYTNGSCMQRCINYITNGTSLRWVKGVGFYEFFWSLIRYLLCFIALIFLWRQKQFLFLTFITSYIFYFSMVTGFDGGSRYRMMFEFILIILAAVGLWRVWCALKGVRNEPSYLCNSSRWKR